MPSVLIMSSSSKFRMAARIDIASMVDTLRPVLGLIFYVLLILVRIDQSKLINGKPPVCSKVVYFLIPLIKLRSQIIFTKSPLDMISSLNLFISTTCKNSSENDKKSLGTISNIFT